MTAGEDATFRARGRAPAGLVLSGGGARGAYEVGVLAGIADVLGLREREPCPFRVFSGTSVGAINTAWAAANAHRGDMNVDGLIREWLALSIDTHLRLEFPLAPHLRDVWWGLWGKARDHRDQGSRWGRALVDVRPLERVVRGGIDWEKLHENTRHSVVHAAAVAALEIGTGRTTIFNELAPDASFGPSKDPRRRTVNEALSAEHVLASAAIPFLFPARRIGDDYYCEGGLRYNTPIAPAIRSGAEHLVVVSLLHRPDERERPASAQKRVEAYPHLRYLLGKLINALLLDSVDYDLQVLERFNELLSVLERTVEPHELEDVQRVVEKSRGMPYRMLHTLVFRPSLDIGAVAADLARSRRSRTAGGRAVARLLRSGAFEDDLLSFLFFDAGFAERLVELGRDDVRARGGEVRRFFDPIQD